MRFPVARLREPGKRPGKSRIVPALRQPRSVVKHTQRAQRLDQQQLTKIEIRELLIARQQLLPLALLLRRRAAKQHPQILNAGAGEAIVEVYEHRTLLIPEEIAQVAISMNTLLAHGANGIECSLHPLQQLAAGPFVLLAQCLGEQAARKHRFAGLRAQALHTQSRPVLERLHAADAMQSPERSSQHLASARRIQLRRPPPLPGKRGKSKPGVPEQRLSLDLQGSGDGQLSRSQFGGEEVLFENLCVGPAARTIKLENAGVAQLIYPVLVAVQRKEAPFALESQPGGGVQHRIRAQACERSLIRGSAFLYDSRLAFFSRHRIPVHMSRGAILVTGGAGYIGSHTVLQLRARGERVVVLDNLYTGFRQSVLDTPFVEANVGDREQATKTMREHGVDTVLHFAAHTIVPESVADPLKYYGNNTCNTRNLLQCCVEAGVKNFVFSSTAAVYGMPSGPYAEESSPTAPINAYGTSKLMSEWMLRDVAAAFPLRYVALRYFNVAGSDTGGRIGQSTRKATLLIKVACEHVVGKRPHLSVFGTDYATPDGTGIRDYIHVEDLATSHLDALDYLRRDGESTILNVGYGHGYSVREVLGSVERVSGQKLKIVEEPRRAGDPAVLVARADKVRSVLGWKPRLDNLDTIVKTSLDWERKLQSSPW